MHSYRTGRYLRPDSAGSGFLSRTVTETAGICGLSTIEALVIEGSRISTIRSSVRVGVRFGTRFGALDRSSRPSLTLSLAPAPDLIEKPTRSQTRI